MLSRKFRLPCTFFLITLFFSTIWGNIGFPQSKISGLTSKLNNLLADKFFESTLIAVDAYDLTEGKILYQKNNKYLLHPASNMKILTSAAGLVFLGPEYEFETSLYYNGNILDGILNGDLFFVGGFGGSQAENNVHAKTGTLSGISALSGYLTAVNGNEIAFSILLQNFVNDVSIARYYQDEICKILAEYK